MPRAGGLGMVSTGMTEVSLLVFSPPETGQLGFGHVQFEEFQKQEQKKHLRLLRFRLGTHLYISSAILSGLKQVITLAQV